MTVSLGTNIQSLRAQGRLAESSSAIGRAYERLSSGLRINRASDDAAGLAIADSLRSNSRVYSQGIRNLSDGLSLLTIADSTIDQLSTITTRLIELAEQAANGTYGYAQRKALDSEAQALSKEFFRISRSARFNGVNLFDGGLSSVRLQGGYGENGGITSSLGGVLGTGAFGSTTQFAAGASLTAVTTGDVNGDGILDIVGADSGSNSLSVLLGRGDGTFAPRVSYALGNNPRSVILDDFNGDGILDVAGVDNISNTLSILLGNGNGSFAARTVTAIGAAPFDLISGDFNGDGKIDLATAESGGNSLGVFLGIGDGSFAPRVSYSLGAGTSPHGVNTGDFNGDGVLDLVTANYGSANIGILLGLGNGQFASPVNYAVGNSPNDVTIGDFNGDGALDIASADSAGGSLSVLLGTGTGTFGTRVSYAAGLIVGDISSADFNGDGVLDLVSTDTFFNTTHVFLGRGNGTFNAMVSYAGGYYGVTTGDFNGDGVSDIVTSITANIGVLIGTTREGVSPLLQFSLSSSANARQALPILKRKLDQLSSQRGVIGAFQSRVEFGINTLTSSRDNFLSAESRIRDADAAQEAANATRLSILQQAARAVLASANQSPAMALKLLSSDQ